MVSISGGYRRDASEKGAAHLQAATERRLARNRRCVTSWDRVKRAGRSAATHFYLPEGTVERTQTKQERTGDSVWEWRDEGISCKKVVWPAQSRRRRRITRGAHREHVRERWPIASVGVVATSHTIRKLAQWLWRASSAAVLDCALYWTRQAESINSNNALTLLRKWHGFKTSLQQHQKNF